MNLKCPVIYGFIAQYRLGVGDYVESVTHETLCYSNISYY